MATFSDSDYNSDGYRSNRPDYGPGLYSLIRDYHCGGDGGGGALDMAADVACGTGQATVHLATMLGVKTVVGIEPSEAMRKAAARHPSVTYVAGTDSTAATATGRPPHSFDLVTAAQCVHWFAMPAFFAQAALMLKRGGRGTLAFWGYPVGYIKNSPRASELFRDYFFNRLGPHWDPRRRLLDAAYEDARFVPTAGLFRDVQRITIPSAHHPLPVMRRTWTLEQLAAYFRTASAYKTYQGAVAADAAANPPATDLVDAVVAEIADALGTDDNGAPRTVDVEWPVILVLARAV
ncbi:S-adenosyl-L-methionine-dependent methyltransferase [Zopfochytrium polystomum]|nr:S-adenosyl-L-methionine-dependent methyltransferase [Zopfochytrium polystomum]